MAQEDQQYAGMKMRAALPKDNGLAPLAPGLSDDASALVLAVAAFKVDDVVYHVEADSKTVVVRLLGIEAGLTDQERSVIREVLDRARQRRTGETALPGMEAVRTAPAPAGLDWDDAATQQRFAIDDDSADEGEEITADLHERQAAEADNVHRLPGPAFVAAEG